MSKTETSWLGHIPARHDLTALPLVVGATDETTARGRAMFDKMHREGEQPDMRRKRRPPIFRQTDVCRLLRAFHAAGIAQPTVRITKEGDLIAIPSDRAKDNPANPWDEILTDAADEKRAS